MAVSSEESCLAEQLMVQTNPDRQVAVAARSPEKGETLTGWDEIGEMRLIDKLS